MPHEAAQSPGRILFENGKPLFQIVLWWWWGCGNRVYNDFFFFFTSSDGLQKNLCAFIFAHSSGSDLLYNYITFYLLRPAFPALLPLAASSLVPVTLSLKGFQVSDVEIKKKREMVGDTVRISASAFFSFFPPFPFLLYSFNLPE